MGYKTKIDWADATWNPVTGCLHGCDYCYARKMAYRFGSVGFESNTENGYECDLYEGTGENHVLNSPTFREWKNGRTTKAPYPFCFDPTFHHYKLKYCTARVLPPPQLLPDFRAWYNGAIIRQAVQP